MISKELFVQSIESLKKQDEYDRKCVDAFQDILNEDRIVIGYNNSILTSQIINILKELTNDDNGKYGGWIEYFIYELNFGENYKIGCAKRADNSPIDLSSPEKLYDFLLESYENQQSNAE